MSLLVTCSNFSLISRYSLSLRQAVSGFKLSRRQYSTRVMATSMKIALCQMKVGKDKTQNIQRAKEKIQEAAKNSADLVVLPEMWNCPYANESFPIYCEELPDPPHTDLNNDISPCFEMMKMTSKDCGVYLVGGSIPEIRDQKLYNSCCVFNPNGEFLAKHRKVHLFDIDIPGKIRFMESETLTSGEKLTLIDTKFGKVGIGICYDIRFPEMAQIYSQAGAKLILYPGAFNMTTGPAHWELLQRARAADNQLFIAMCSPSRNEEGYQAWGHSTITGPFGEIIASCEEKETIVYSSLNLDEIEVRRTNMPLANQKRNDLYELLSKS